MLMLFVLLGFDLVRVVRVRVVGDDFRQQAIKAKIRVEQRRRDSVGGCRGKLTS
jgi:hypothetical protein